MISLLLNVQPYLTTSYYLQQFLSKLSQDYLLLILKKKIRKIIRNLNVNKAHGQDNISIRMLKICDSVLVEPMSLIYKHCINGVFPDIWKRSHIIPIYKKKMINVALITNKLFLYYQFVAKYLNVFVITLYSYTYTVTTC